MHHILVVDDNPIDRQLARSILERRADFHVEFASNGAEAVEHLEATTPLAIVTDLQMPEMDGLSLVRSVRRRFPTIPVVLMTAHGSEQLAVEALVAGAADYIPKHRLAHDLARAIESLLTTGIADRQREQMMPYLRYNQLQYDLPSDLNLIPPLVDQLLKATASVSLVEAADHVRLAKCLAEALRNAIVHGSRGAGPPSQTSSPPAHQLGVTAELTPQEGQFVIRDQGRGFEHSAIVDPRRSPDHLTSNSGKGLALIQLFMSEVRFNTEGNEITLIKRRSSNALPNC